MSLIAPEEGWYNKKVSADEKIWIVLATVVSLVTFFWMIVWHIYGNQNPSSESYRITPAEFVELRDAFISQNQIGEEMGYPVVKPEPGSRVFISGQMWSWSPIVVLQKGEWYTFHLSSLDILHGFSVQPINMNFMVYPGYDYVMRFKPTEAGEYKIVCNEFCGIGHHLMVGKLIVIEDDEDLQRYGFDQKMLTKNE